MTEAALQKLQTFVNDRLADEDSLRVLEAGCGSATYLKFTPACYFVGIDISNEQLRRNSMLDEKILGDVQSYSFPANLFDLVVCWNVLEHVKRPDLAIKNFAIALKPDGLLILSLPNVYSVKGLLTRLTPHWFHVFMYRYAYGVQDAGKNDQVPFKSYMRRAIAKDRLIQIAAEHQMDVVYYFMYSDDYLGAQLLFLKRLYKISDRIARRLTLGRLGESEFHIVFRKR
jgi:SAM-dependent methyltransferase